MSYVWDIDGESSTIEKGVGSNQVGYSICRGTGTHDDDYR